MLNLVEIETLDDNLTEESGISIGPYKVNRIYLHFPDDIASFASSNLLTTIYSCTDSNLDFYTPLDGVNDETTKGPTPTSLTFMGVTFSFPHLEFASYVAVNNQAPGILMIGSDGNNGSNNVAGDVGSDPIIFNNCQNVGWGTIGTNINPGERWLMAQLTINAASSGVISLFKYGSNSYTPEWEEYTLSVIDGVVTKN